MAESITVTVGPAVALLDMTARWPLVLMKAIFVPSGENAGSVPATVRSVGIGLIAVALAPKSSGVGPAE